jgi:uncharacterized membrane protein
METPDKPAKKRIISIDVLRGIVIAIMALDHTREFFSSFRYSPTDLAHTTTELFITRWITHFCAPVFVFVAGTGAFLYYVSRGRSAEITSRFLWTRGLFLVLMELTVIRFAASFNFNYYDTTANILQVIWAIGWSMIFLAALVRLPSWVIAVVGGVIVIFHNLLDDVASMVPGSLQWLFTILHVRDYITVAPGIEFLVAYPLIPWIGVMALGFSFGNIFYLEDNAKQKLLLRIGVGMAAAFVVIRWLNIYGDPIPWTYEGSWLFTFLSFINCTKYPPSLLFLLMTLSLPILFLSFMKERETPLSRIFLVFGRVPMFFYILHIFVLHAAAVVFAWVSYGSFPSWMLTGNPIFSSPAFPAGPADYGYGLIIVYALWLLLLAALWPLCRWYMNYKRTHNYWILRYL